MASETILGKGFEKKSQGESKMSKAKEIIFAWSQSVDINCYTKIMDYRPNYKIQFIWLVILLGSTGATFYFIAKSLIDYFGYEVVSKTNVVYEIPTQFPTVTFCDNNPFSTYEAQAYMESIGKINNISSDSSVVFLTQLNASNPSTSDDMRKNLGLNLGQISCTYDYTDCLNDLHWYWSFFYGNCYQFNLGLNLTNQNVDLKETYRNGKGFGLNIKIDLIDENEYLSSYANGLVVYVHNSSFQPSEEINVEPGKLTSIKVKRTFVEKQPSPYSDCIELTTYSSLLYDYIINSSRNYRQQDCFELCLQKLAIEQCKCYFPGYQNLSTQVRPCLILSDYDCLDQQYTDFNMNECQTKYCPLECNSVKVLNIRVKVCFKIRFIHKIIVTISKGFIMKHLV